MRKIASLIVAVVVVASPAPSIGGAPSADQSCTRESVAALVKSFVRAYNRGDIEGLDQMWSAEPDFEWYSVSPNEREREDAYDRNTLLPYFEQRHLLGDHMRLKQLSVGPQDDRGNFGIAYRLRRRSGQIAGRGLYHGKASAKGVMALPTADNLSLSRCVLIVWSMGRPQR